MSIEVIGPTVYVPIQSAFSYPNPFQPDAFPKEPAGRIVHWDSHFTTSSPLEQAADPEVASAPAQIHMANFVSWAPWMGMGQMPGRTFGRGYGRKLAGIEEVPEAVMRNVERYTPEVLDIENWSEFYDDVAAYKAKLEAERGMDDGE